MTETSDKKLTRRQLLLVAAILLSAFTGLVMGLLRWNGLEASALLYIGVPTIMALAFTRLSPSKSVMGSTLKAITFVILISGPLLQEGFICMIMAAPILYLVGALVAWPFDHYRKKNAQTGDSSSLNVYILPAIFLLMSMEGVFEETSFNRFHSSEHTQIIDASPGEIKGKLGAARALGVPESLFAKLFPLPNTLNAEGLAAGDRHWVDLSYVKWVYWNETSGRLQFEVASHQSNSIIFKPVSDDSYIGNYLAWEDSEVYLQPVDENRTAVTWRINYQRKLDPAWYMQPLQSYMTKVAAELLVDSLR